MAQVFLPEGDRVPVLTTIDRLGGGPIGLMGTPTSLTIMYRGLVIVLTCNEDADEDAWPAE